MNENEKSSEDVVEGYVSQLKRKDFIMEPTAVQCLNAFIDSGGLPEEAIHLLSSNYEAVAQMVNLLADWLLQLDASPGQVQEIIEGHFYDVIMKTFDAKKADLIFSMEGRAPDWLGNLVEEPRWRKLIFALAEEWPDCLMLNFTVKLIAEAGFQGEITGVATACQQLEVFTGVLNNSVKSICEDGTDGLETHVDELAKIVQHAEHSFMYALALLSALAQEHRGGSLARRIKQEILKSVSNEQNSLDIVTIDFAIDSYGDYPKVAQALSTMLSKNQLNPADITLLYKCYQSTDEENVPPVSLLKVPQLLLMLKEAIFSKKSKLNRDHKYKYVYILAYAVTVFEDHARDSKGNRRRRNIHSSDLKTVCEAIDTVSCVLAEKTTGHELLPEVWTIFEWMKHPVVSGGVLHWVEEVVEDDAFYDRNIESTPIPLAFLDEIASLHSLQRDQVFHLLKKLFLKTFSGLSAHARIELDKMIVDRMVHILCLDYVEPVMIFMTECMNNRLVDLSLIRYFVTQLLELAAPPYTDRFLALVRPFLQNESITEVFKLGSAEDDAVKELLSCC